MRTKHLFVSIFTVLTGIQAHFYQEHRTGWFWYKDSSLQEKKIPSHSLKPQKPKSYQTRLRESKKVLNESLARAVLVPTLENVKAFQTLQQKTIQQAENFEKMWMLASTVSPQGGFRHPAAREIQRKEEEKRWDILFRKAAQRYGFFYLFKADCPYCHEFAPILQSFAGKYGFHVKSISKQGGVLKEFPDSSSDNGVIDLINPKGIFPALFLVDPETQMILPITFGMISLDELRENMKIVLSAVEKKEKKHDF